jgi:hypothetical protein
MGKYEECLSMFDSQVKDEDFYFYYVMGRALFFMGDFEKAGWSLKKAIELSVCMGSAAAECAALAELTLKKVALEQGT